MSYFTVFFVGGGGGFEVFVALWKAATDTLIFKIINTDLLNRALTEETQTSKPVASASMYLL